MNVQSHYQIRGKSSNRIAAEIEGAIREGRLPTGARLPAIRELACGLRISPTTVAAAYRDLRLRGLIRGGSGRRGTLVNRRPPLATPAGPAIPADIRNLADGNPDPALLPKLAPILAKIDLPPMLYGHPANRDDLVRLARRNFAADGIEARSIAVLSGAMDSIERVLQAHLKPGDAVAVEDPCYSGVFDLIAALGLAVEPIALDENGLAPRDLARALKAGVRAIVVTPRAQNPTGAAFTPERASELRGVLARWPELLVIEDDFAAAVSGAPPATIIDHSRPRWAVVRSVSKTLGPDLRLAMVAGDDATIARVEGRQRLGARWVSHVLQTAVARLWSDAKVGALVRRAEVIYSKRRERLVGELALFGVEARGRSGLNVWVPVEREGAAVQALQERGWGVRAGENYRLRSGPGIRITISTLELDEAPRLARDIAETLRPSRESTTA